jgi:hypothetical protein
MRNDLLEQDVHVKDYGGINIPLTEQQRNTSIPEPDFIPPPFNMDDIPNGADGGGNYSQPANSGGGEDEEDSPKARMAEAKMLTSLIINGYEQLNKIGEQMCKINNNKIVEMHEEGKINLYQPLPIGANGALEYITTYIEQNNSRIDGMLAVSEEFKESIAPPLNRILAKKGLGASDEQTVLFILGMDLAKKAPVVYEVTKENNKFYKKIVQVYDQQKEIIANGFANSIQVVNTNEPPKQTANVVSPLSGEGKDSLDVEVEKPNLEIKPKKAGRGRPKKENKTN